MASKYFILSNFGVRYFLEDFIDENTVPSVGTNELKGILSCSLGTITKETRRYKTLDGDGWDSIVTLGQTQEDATFEAIRLADGDIYEGDNGSSTYTNIKHWFMQSTSQGGVASPKAIIEILPRGDGIFEGTCYFVIPSRFGPGTRDVETGQEYSFDVSPFGPPIPVKVTYEDGQWKFEKYDDGSGVSGGIGDWE